MSSAKPKEKEGGVKLNCANAELFLRNAKGTYRLLWKADEAGQPRWLPAGNYRLLGYRMTKGEWFVSSTAGSRRLDIQPGKTLSVELDQKIHIRLKTRWRGALRVQAAVTGHAKAGLAIYRKGRRIPFEFSVLNGTGKSSSRGTMDYG